MPSRLLFPVLFSVLLIAGGVEAQAQASRTVSRAFDFPRDGSVVLDAYSGRVDVETWDQPRVAIDVTIEGGERERVDKTEIRFDRSKDTLDIKTDYTRLVSGIKILGFTLFGGTENRPSTDYTLRIPRATALELDVYSADATVPVLEAPLAFDAYSGDLEVRRVRGSLDVDTYSGNAQIGGLDGRLTANTYSGDVQVDSLAGSAAFGTHSGSAQLTFATLAGDCTFDSYSGNVTVTVPAGAGTVVKTNEGALETDLPVRTERTDNTIRATLGDGGPRLRFETYSGTLFLRAQ